MTVKHTETYDGTTITHTYEAETVAELIDLMQELQKERRRSEEQDRPKKDKPVLPEIETVRRLRAHFLGETPAGVQVGSSFTARWTGPNVNESFAAVFRVLSAFGTGELISDGPYQLPRTWPWTRNEINVNTPFGWHTLVVQEEVDRVEIASGTWMGPGTIRDRAPAEGGRAAPGAGAGDGQAGERAAGARERESQSADPQQHGGGLPDSSGQRDGDGGSQGTQPADRIDEVKAGTAATIGTIGDHKSWFLSLVSRYGEAMANGRFAEGYLLLEEITQAIFRTKVDLSGRRIHDLEHALESACAALKEHSKDSEHVTPAEVIAAWKRLARGE